MTVFSILTELQTQPKRAMSYEDSFDITFLATGSQLLSESPLLPSSSRTGHGGDDLSLSELSIPDRGSPFTLLARRPTELPTPAHDDGDDELFGGDVGDTDREVPKDEDTEKIKRAAARHREEKLQSDIFILKKINASFAAYNEALSDTESAHQVRSV
jgi:hypothetical protein